MRDVAITGIGLTPFGSHPQTSLGELSERALGAALEDAGLDAEQVEIVFFSNAAAGLLTGQEMIRGEVALKGAGLRGCPIANVENACASGGTAAHLAWLAVASGHVDVAVAVGAEKLIHPDKSRSFAAIESGTDLTVDVGEKVQGSVMMSAYARKAREYAERHGDVAGALAAIAVKNRAHAAANPNAQFQTPISVDDVRASRVVAAPLHLLMCSPLTDGAGAVVFRAAPTGDDRAVWVRASVLRSHDGDAEVVRRAVTQVFRDARTRPEDIDVFALHDASAFAELYQYEQVGLARPGESIELATRGETSVTGHHPVNTDGGLLSRGHALGATGLAQLAELVCQLRREADGRQVANPVAALAVNAGGWMGEDYAATAATVLASRPG